MAKILPFRAYRFDVEKVGSLSAVVTQPYDKIDAKAQEEYYKRHENNIVRVTKGKEEPGDTDQKNKYTRAGGFLKQWIESGVLVRDEKPAVYAYYQTFSLPGGEKRVHDGVSAAGAASYQTFTVPGGEKKVRKGFIALGALEEFGKGGVHAHEHTLAKPKQDRLNLTRATGATTGHIFMLYADKKLSVNRITDAEAQSRPPDLSAKDDYGAIHEVWRITDSTKIEKIVKEMATKELFIADGHHRYETALNFREELRKKGAKWGEGTETPDSRMMTFVNMEDEGLVILPTHRLIHSLAGFDFKKFRAALDAHFNVREYPFKQAAPSPCSCCGGAQPSRERERAEETVEAFESRARAEMLEDLKIEGQEAHVFGLAAKGTESYFLLTLKNEKEIDKLITETHSAEWKRLDVSILHALILEKMLGIDKKKLEAQENVEYVRQTEDALEGVRSGKFQLAFLLNPTKLSEVREIAGKGERMPQKSTDFYPKLLSGLLINKMNIES